MYIEIAAYKTTEFKIFVFFCHLIQSSSLLLFCRLESENLRLSQIVSQQEETRRANISSQEEDVMLLKEQVRFPHSFKTTVFSHNESLSHSIPLNRLIIQSQLKRLTNQSQINLIIIQSPTYLIIIQSSINLIISQSTKLSVDYPISI